MAKISSFKDRILSIIPKFKGGEKKYIINNVRVAPPHRDTADIGKWRTAIKSAEGYTQNRQKIFDLYKDILLDGYLLATIQKRIDQVTNRQLVFVKDGEVIEEVTKLAQTTYFEDLLTEVMNSKFWGHSLLELHWPAFGSKDKGETLLIPRKHVKPRFGIVTKEQFGTEGIDYRQESFSNRTIEVGKAEDLGLLMAVAQYAIYKRGNFGDWAEYAEVFGIPFRWATYNNEQSRKMLETALEEAGSAGYVVAPQDADLKFLNANNTGQGQEVFRTLRDACNEEIALAILANTMTTMDAKSSGYAQSKTHAKAESETNASDRRFVTRLLNEQLVPVLEFFGYPVQEGEWQFAKEDQMTLMQRIDVDIKVASQVPVSESYWYETYGIPKPDSSDIVHKEPKAEAGKDSEQEEEDDQKPDAPGKTKAQGKTLRLGFTDRGHEVAQLYAQGCGHLHLSDAPTVRFQKIPERISRSLANSVFTGRLTGDDLSAALHRQYYRRLRDFVKAGFGRSLGNPADFADLELSQGILRNISEFAAAKQHALIEELSAAAVRPRPDYDRAAKGILKRYNDSYLRTELLTFEGAAHAAGQWRDFEDRADIYPNLRYETVGDDRVRNAHAVLDGAVYPVNDPFWDTHTPPIDWRCRCILIQTDEDVQPKAGAEIRAGFGANPAKAKALIQRDHPYFRLEANRLEELMNLSEVLRSQIERNGNKRRALKASNRTTDISQFDKLDISKDEMEALLNSTTVQPAVRDALLGNLALISSELERIIQSNNRFEIYALEFLGTSFSIATENINGRITIRQFKAQ